MQRAAGTQDTEMCIALAVTVGTISAAAVGSIAWSGSLHSSTLSKAVDTRAALVAHTACHSRSTAVEAAAPGHKQGIQHTDRDMPRRMTWSLAACIVYRLTGRFGIEKGRRGKECSRAFHACMTPQVTSHGPASRGANSRDHLDRSAPSITSSAYD